jgi:stage V sporulation protein AD
MTFKYSNVYLNNASTVCGPYEYNGPLGSCFDKNYEDFHMGEKTWEQAEIKLLEDSINILLNKQKTTPDKVDLLIAGDLLNQITASTYTASLYSIPFLGVYSACASFVEGLIVGSNMIDAKQIKNCICGTSSHNLSAEKQFRYPSEYGAPKPKRSTFTSTGGVAVYLSNKKSKIKIDSATIGRVLDFDNTDPFHMGAVMANAAADTISRHLEDTNRNVNYYDLIITGDLGLYGKAILIEYMRKQYDIKLHKYNDCGIMLYDLKKQKVFAGGSGPVCSALVTFGSILKKLNNKELKKVLLVATGALFSPTFLFQKKTIPSIANAISLEVVE